MVFTIEFPEFGKRTTRAMLDRIRSAHPRFGICTFIEPRVGSHWAFTIGGGFHSPVSASDFGASRISRALNSRYKASA
jgi:hypothetical protein